MKGRILVIDDEKAFCSFLRCVFNHEGYAVETARNGREGLLMASQMQFDLVITDMMMPELDGAGLVAGIRNAGNEVPIIAITAYTPFEVRLDDAKRNRIDCVLKKPFTANEVRRAVEQVMGAAKAPGNADECNRYLPFGNAGI